MHALTREPCEVMSKDISHLRTISLYYKELWKRQYMVVAAPIIPLLVRVKDERRKGRRVDLKCCRVSRQQ